MKIVLRARPDDRVLKIKRKLSRKKLNRINHRIDQISHLLRDT